MTSTETLAFNLHPELITVVPLVFLCLTALAVSLRLYVRGYMLRAFGLDDWILLFAWCLFVVDCSIWIKVGVVERTQGLLKPIIELFKLTIIGDCVYLLDQMAIKWALATFFLRINKKKTHRWIIITSVSIYTLFTITYMFVGIFQCGVPKPNDFFVAVHCLGWKHVLEPLTYIAAILNAVTDWVFTGVTVSVILETQIRRTEKASVCLIIALGALGSVVSVARIPFVQDLKPSEDFFSKSPLISMLSLAESAIGIIAISAATLRPLFRLWLEKSGIRTSVAQLTRTYQSTQAKITVARNTRLSTELVYMASPEKVDAFGITSIIEAVDSDKASVDGRSVHETV